MSGKLESLAVPLCLRSIHERCVQIHGSRHSWDRVTVPHWGGPTVFLARPAIREPVSKSVGCLFQSVTSAYVFPWAASRKARDESRDSVVCSSAFRRGAFKAKVQVLSTHVTVLHRRGSPIFITRLAFHGPVSNSVRPLFQTITGSETFAFIAALNDNSPFVAAVTRDLLKRRPVCVLERNRERAPLTLTCDALKEMDGYTGTVPSARPPCRAVFTSGSGQVLSCLGGSAVRPGMDFLQRRVVLRKNAVGRLTGTGVGTSSHCERRLRYILHCRGRGVEPSFL